MLIERKKKKDESNEPRQSLYNKRWSILSNIMTHLKDSAEEIEVMLSKNFDKKVQQSCSINCKHSRFVRIFGSST